VTVLLLGGLIGVVIAGYWFALPWTGLTAYTDPTGDYHPDKTLWDWLSLLFVPVVIGVATYVFRRTEQNIERQRAEERAKIEKDAANRRAETERALALDAQRETAFQTYLDQMTYLLLDKQLRTSKAGAEVRSVARARTLTILRDLDEDGLRKGAVVKFLYEARLIGGIEASNLSEGKTTTDAISRFNAVIDLVGANLAGADLRKAVLSGVVLRETDLHGASFSGTFLEGADLQGANLIEVGLQRADLSGAVLTGATVTSEQLATAKSVEGATLPSSLETRRAQDSRGHLSETRDEPPANLLADATSQHHPPPAAPISQREE